MTHIIKLNNGEQLVMSHLGCCRLSALIDGIELIDAHARAGLPIKWDREGALRAYVETHGNEIYNGNPE